ncbi:GntR family transcriptional regulator [Rhodococcus zopfii]|uniref:GntR family transcriptional regulator n=1 Tax=Rhodococcus zopfii TaxID=43772 RepID=A0ABU3WJZ2_9NOCA|nr:GntR family transcriptional regulator [Rhodococcus zopfii]MDV2474291.1 GntR family transcriptional regulator [Rhodococcus zopfii]
MEAETVESATEKAYRSIRDSILNGELPSGSMLGEASLAARIGVSRTPVRTALARLQDEGWVTIYPKRGALVQGLTVQTIEDLADTRLIFESISVQRSSSRARQALADRLDDAVTEQQAAIGAHDLRRFVESTIAFHRSFVECGGNEVLLELNDRLADRQRFLLFSHGDRLFERGEAIITEHRELVGALRTGDVAGFADTLRSHLSHNYGRRLDPVRLEVRDEQRSDT